MFFGVKATYTRPSTTDSNYELVLVASGSRFDMIVALGFDQSVKADLFRCVLIAEVAKADAVFAGLWHEPGGFRDGLRLLAPGTLYNVLGQERSFSHGKLW